MTDTGYPPSHLARELNVSVETIYNLINSGLIAHIHVGWQIRIPRAECERVKKEGTGEPRKKRK